MAPEEPPNNNPPERAWQATVITAEMNGAPTTIVALAPEMLAALSAGNVVTIQMGMAPALRIVCASNRRELMQRFGQLPPDETPEDGNVH